MKETSLYLKIAESIRRDIMQKKLNPGDRLPSIREMTLRWKCTPGTVQRAYQELVRLNLITSHVGQGTHVISAPNPAQDFPLRKISLAHKADAFLFEAVTSGFSIEEAEQSFRLAVDHWKSIQKQTSPLEDIPIRFLGSHDIALSWLTNKYSEITGTAPFIIHYVGSLGGLIALAEGKGQIAGIHLWDSESDSYNIPFVKRLLPGKKVSLLTLAHRRLGVILPVGNPFRVQNLSDLTHADIRFINRQDGSGTRVWLESNMHRSGIDPICIHGYQNEKLTHTDVARAIAEEEANAGIGLEVAALSYGLDFVFLARERYDLVFFNELLDQPVFAGWVKFLQQTETKAAIAAMGGYDVSETGRIVNFES
jgi:putative molybdopterin biosynthesis protein